MCSFEWGFYPIELADVHRQTFPIRLTVVYQERHIHHFGIIETNNTVSDGIQ